MMCGLRAAWSLVLSVALGSCGLIVDAVQAIHPLVYDEVEAVCRRGQLRVGMSVEPFRPFVFPAIYTDEGVRVTGLDVALVREIATALAVRCGEGRFVQPQLELVRFRDLFLELHEGNLDLFISAKTMNVVSTYEAGLAYTIPYYYDGGVIAVVRKGSSSALKQALAGKRAHRDVEAFKLALKGVRAAVQATRSPHRYVEANVPGVRLVLCDSLPAAFESQEPSVDVIFGKRPILEHMVKYNQKDWQVLTDDAGTPWLLTREHYAIVTAEDSYALRWFLSDLLFQMEQDGRLARLRHRWFEQEYAYPRRASLEGLPFDANKMPQHYYLGGCTAQKD